MRYKAEIFDSIQYFYDTTGYNDHQLHCMITFTGKIQVSAIKTAVELLIKTVPILSRGYKNYQGCFYWEDLDTQNWEDLFTIVDNKDDFERFTFSKSDVENGPQMKACLLQAESDSLCILINHMVTDGAGMKNCIYRLSDIYSNLLKNPDYCPSDIIDGDRGFKKAVSGVRLMDRIKILLLQRKENNQRCDAIFPMSNGEQTSPFLLTHEVPSERFTEMKRYCKNHHVTVNDIILTAYFRVLSGMLSFNGKALNIPFMIDMRRYLADKRTDALSNLSSTAILSTTIQPGEHFSRTLSKITAEMAVKKQHHLGMNTFLKLDLEFLKSKLGNRILKKSLNNPKISITNIGIIDSEQLRFKGSVIKNVCIYGSIKYRPYFQMAISSFEDKMTFCIGLYGDHQDEETISHFFACMDNELNAVAEI